jgi:hypothetical protein
LRLVYETGSEYGPSANLGRIHLEIDGDRARLTRWRMGTVDEFETTFDARALEDELRASGFPQQPLPPRMIVPDTTMRSLSVDGARIIVPTHQEGPYRRLFALLDELEKSITTGKPLATGSR